MSIVATLSARGAASTNSLGLQVDRSNASRSGKTSDDSYGAPQRSVRRGVKWLANRGLAIARLVAESYVSPALRGESTYALARKEGRVKSRFPEFLYYSSRPKPISTIPYGLTSVCARRRTTTHRRL